MLILPMPRARQASLRGRRRARRSRLVFLGYPIRDLRRVSEPIVLVRRRVLRSVFLLALQRHVRAVDNYLRRGWLDVPRGLRRALRAAGDQDQCHRERDLRRRVALQEEQLLRRDSAGGERKGQRVRDDIMRRRAEVDVAPVRHDVARPAIDFAFGYVLPQLLPGGLFGCKCLLPPGQSVQGETRTRRLVRQPLGSRRPRRPSHRAAGGIREERHAGGHGRFGRHGRFYLHHRHQCHPRAIRMRGTVPPLDG